MAEPGTANEATTVGSYVTRVTLTSQVGQVGYQNPPPLGSVSSFSGRGTTRDGRPKPNVIAPGEGIFSAKSQDVTVQPELVSPDGRHFLSQGTSMASPAVAGVVALMLQRSRTLSPDDLIPAIQDTARGNAGRYDTASGFGKVDALALYQRVAGPADTPTPTATVAAPTATAAPPTVTVAPPTATVAANSKVFLPATLRSAAETGGW
ncbi:MAG TPA: S8 family serine peptidase [Dehalococcoidia bacterium]|nr:S8 family serine peptidase [Dehalococcoidia bacterium]